MSVTDERIRTAITHALSRQGVDARNLAVDVLDGAVSVRGSVPSNEQRARVAPAVGAVVQGGKTAQIAVQVIPQTSH
jgi:osmotically-inducible protein OsmY